MNLDALFRAEHGRVLAAVLARVRDFPVAEESVQEAFAAAVEQWGTTPPPNQRAWLLRVAINKAFDRARRAVRFPQLEADALTEPEVEIVPEQDNEIPDERLRLVFTCCHPSLAPEAQVALTLRTVAGLSTEEIARLFLVDPTAMAQRLVRTQRKIRDARIPYAVPAAAKLEARIAAALAVVYLVFTEGYSPSQGESPLRSELCDEAIRLGRLIADLLPHESEAVALLALMLLHDGRRDARFRDGELVLLEDQDRSQWDAQQTAEALRLLDRALATGAHGPYTIQAAIAGLHARAAKAEDTDWRQVVQLYDLLLAAQATPVTELNRAAAMAMAFGPERGLRELDALRFKLPESHLFHAARADLLARLARREEAAQAYRAALARVTLPAERRFLERRLAACAKSLES